MAPDQRSVRRVTTGHDTSGQSRVLCDETLPFVALSRPGASAATLFASADFPADNGAGDPYAALPAPEAGMECGSFARMLCFEPGVAPKMHATATLDYAVVVEGVIRMELDQGTVELHAGDVLVQRGTMHNWINPGPKPCRIFVVLTSARPLSISDS